MENDIKTTTTLDTFLPTTTYVKTMYGEDIVVPKVAIKKDKRILEIVSKQLEKLVTETGTVSMNDVLNVMGPDTMVAVAAIVLEREQGWVEENFDLTTLTEFVIPFFLRFLVVLKTMEEKFTQLLGKS